MVAANPVPANCLQQAKRPLHVCVQERLGVSDGAVVAGLGGAVHDGVAPRGKPVEEPGVADVAHDELDPVRGIVPSEQKRNRLLESKILHVTGLTVHAVISQKVTSF